MRKIFLLFILAVASHMGFAQFNTIQFSPVTFTGEDSVTFTIDLSTTSLAGESEVYIWIFANNGSTDAQYPFKGGINTNTDWGNSPAAAKFTHVSGDIWSFTFAGTEMFGLTPGQLKYFQFLAKTKTGNKQTSDSPRFPFAPVSYVPSIYRLFPRYMNQDDAITIYFYQNLASDITESRMTPQVVTVTLYDAAGNVYGTPKDFSVTDLSGKVFQFQPFIPAYAWSIPAGVTMSKFTYVVKGTYYDTSGGTVSVTGPVNTRTFDILH